MADARHKRTYPEGTRRQMTDLWKQAVRNTLKRNKAEGREPADQSQLARAIGVHKTAINKMWVAESSALVDPICVVLGLGHPMMEADPEDELSAEISKLDVKDRAKVLKFIREFLQ